MFQVNTPFDIDGLSSGNLHRSDLFPELHNQRFDIPNVLPRLPLHLHFCTFADAVHGSIQTIEKDAYLLVYLLHWNGCHNVLCSDDSFLSN